MTSLNVWVQLLLRVWWFVKVWIVVSVILYVLEIIFFGLSGRMPVAEVALLGALVAPIVAGLIRCFFGTGPRWPWAASILAILLLGGAMVAMLGQGDVYSFVFLGVFASVSMIVIGFIWALTGLSRPDSLVSPKRSGVSLSSCGVPLRTLIKHHGEVWLIRYFSDAAGNRAFEVIGRWERSGFARPGLPKEALSDDLSQCFSDEWVRGGQHVLISLRWKGARSQRVTLAPGVPVADQSPTQRRRVVMSALSADVRLLVAQHSALSQREAGLAR